VWVPSHLLKDQAIRPDPRAGVYNNAIRMWQQWVPRQSAVKRDIRTRYDSPESMAAILRFLKICVMG